ncbi:MAG: hypothetical protein CMK59_12175 [Proteobacteria bacterium]|nr:hypothetical protein [Pseudomonadota bacterium]
MLPLLLIACAPKQIDPSNVDPHIISLGRSLFSKHIMAIGGSTAVKRHQTLLTQGKVRTPDNQVDLSFKTYRKAPNQILSIIEVIEQDGNAKHYIKGFDGDLGWENSPQNIRQLEGKELELLKQEADFYASLNHETWYPHLLRITEQEFAGHPTYRLETYNHLEEREDLFFDQESHLLLGKVRMVVPEINSETQAKKRSQRDIQESTTEIWTRYGHYVMVEDVQIPFSMEVNIDQTSKLILLEEATWDLSPSEKEAILIEPFSEPIQFPSSMLPNVQTP